MEISRRRGCVGPYGNKMGTEQRLRFRTPAKADDWQTAARGSRERRDGAADFQQANQSSLDMVMAVWRVSGIDWIAGRSY
jgi:hypothetical protein